MNHKVLNVDTLHTDATYLYTSVVMGGETSADDYDDEI